MILMEVEMEEYITFAACRISTAKQNIDRQERNILSLYPDAIVIKETYTGTKFDGRKEWNKLYKRIVELVKTKKVRVVFDSVSRFSRNAEEGCELYEDLFRRGVALVFLKEPHINTDVYREALQRQIDICVNTGNSATDKFLNSIIEALNKFVIDIAKEQIRISFEQAEKEVTDLRQRTKEGIETARLAGKRIGQTKGAKLNVKKSAPAKEQIKKYNRDFGGQLNNEETWKLIGISKMTFYKYKKELIMDGQV